MSNSMRFAVSILVAVVLSHNQLFEVTTVLAAPALNVSPTTARPSNSTTPVDVTGSTPPPSTRPTTTTTRRTSSGRPGATTTEYIYPLPTFSTTGATKSPTSGSTATTAAKILSPTVPPSTPTKAVYVPPLPPPPTIGTTGNGSAAPSTPATTTRRTEPPRSPIRCVIAYNNSDFRCFKEDSSKNSLGVSNLQSDWTLFKVTWTIYNGTCDSDTEPGQYQERLKSYFDQEYKMEEGQTVILPFPNASALVATYGLNRTHKINSANEGELCNELQIHSCKNNERNVQCYLNVELQII